MGGSSFEFVLTHPGRNAVGSPAEGGTGSLVKLSAGGVFKAQNDIGHRIRDDLKRQLRIQLSLTAGLP
jgi:hypothetical protein